MKVLIVGGGIGGLTLGLALGHRGLTDVELFEASPDLHEVGVGMNLQSGAVEVLTKLGLGPAIEAQAVAIEEVRYLTRHGQEVWTDRRGTGTGMAHDQHSIHRGRLLSALLDGFRRRFGDGRIHTGHPVSRLVEREDEVELTFTSEPGDEAEAPVRGDVVVGADGVWSTVRRLLFPRSGDARWNGVVMWRGNTAHPPVMGRPVMVVIGQSGLRFRAHPIAGEAGAPSLTWVAEHRELDWTPEPRPDWGREDRFADAIAAFSGFRFPWLDVPDVMHRAEAVFEHPMVDHDPLPRWSVGRVTLLGDAAHAALPVASSGGSQAILDAWTLATELARPVDPEVALAAYEAERRPLARRIIQLNRLAGPVRSLDLAAERAPQGFGSLDEVFAPGELESIVRGSTLVDDVR